MQICVMDLSQEAHRSRTAKGRENPPGPPDGTKARVGALPGEDRHRSGGEADGSDRTDHIRWKQFVSVWSRTLNELACLPGTAWFEQSSFKRN